VARASRATVEEPAWSIPSLREPRYSQSLERGLAIVGCFTPQRPVLGIADIADERVPRTLKEDRCRTNRRMRCCMRDGGLVLCGRPAGGGCKPPQAAPVKSWSGERCGKGALMSVSGVDYEGERKRTIDEVSKAIYGDIKTGVGFLPRDESGGCLSTGQVVSGMKVARAWSGLLCGTWEPVALRLWAASGAVLARGCSWTGDPQAAGTVRGRVPMWGTGADRPVVVVKPGNAGGAKGTGRPGLLAGQPCLTGGTG
jgi:hypothetical protein